MLMRRRVFVAAKASAAVAWPSVGWPQQRQTWRIGYLVPGFIFGPDLKLLEVFKQELNTLAM